MVEARWLQWFGPGLLAVGTLALVGSATVGADTRTTLSGPLTQLPCADPPAGRIAMHGGGAVASLADGSPAPWFRLDPVIDRDGALAGQRLALGLDGIPGARTLDLPAESFAAGPFGRTILVGADDGITSTLRLYDVAAGCGWSIAAEPSVIRRATVDSDGTAVYEMRVDRTTRADLGVWIRPVDGGLPARRILAAPAPDGRFGRTWSTELRWDLDGARLAVQSCGDVACRTRIIDPAGGAALMLDAPDLGNVIGLDGDRLVTYAACRGRPCPIVSTDLSTGARVVLADAGGPAVVADTADGARLVDEVPAVTGRRLRAIPIGGGPTLDLGPIPEGLGLESDPDVAGSATELPVGWILLAPDGRMPADGSFGTTRLRHIPDGMTVPLAEAAR